MTPEPTPDPDPPTPTNYTVTYNLTNNTNKSVTAFLSNNGEYTSNLNSSTTSNTAQWTVSSADNTENLMLCVIISGNSDLDYVAKINGTNMSYHNRGGTPVYYVRIDASTNPTIAVVTQ